jgi:RNA polymerase sigma factor (sigma-70 family)
MSPGLPPDGKLTDEMMNLIECNLGLAYYLAKRFCQDRRMHIEDRCSIATAGLIAAAVGFDPARGHTFAAYAGASIYHHLMDALRDAHAVHIPKGEHAGFVELPPEYLVAADHTARDEATADDRSRADELLSTLDAETRRHVEAWMSGATLPAAYGYARDSAGRQAGRRRHLVVMQIIRRAMGGRRKIIARLKITGGRP